MSDIVDLGKERRYRVHDNREWSAKDCLQAALDIADEDPPQAVLTILIYDDDEGYDQTVVSQNLAVKEKTAALEVCKFDILIGARGE